MCGISAIITKNKDYHDKIDEMTDIVKYRGPDARGIFQNGHVSLGHRRLKIIDLSDSANQPMEYKGIRIVYNGEIYNYTTLREELISIGYPFDTTSDTEVLLKLYHWCTKQNYSIELLLNGIRGMFAFVIYDENKGEIIAARDRFGIKPLYYRFIEGGVAFASEIKQFMTLPNWKPTIDPYMKDMFLQQGLVDNYSILTIFDDVFLVKPGSYVTFKDGDDGVCETQWYNLYDVVKNKTPSTSSFLTIQWLLKDAVLTHLQSDVPVGSCLSGGIDSTSIVCMVNKLNEGNGKQFTVSARTKADFDEGKWIDIVDTYCGNIERHDVYPEFDDVLKLHPKVVYHQDSPIPTSSMVAQWMVFEEAGKHVKVMLDGQGADEIFAGYHMYFGTLYASLLRRGKIYTLLKEMSAAKSIPGYDQTFAIKCAANSLKNYPTVFDYSYNQVTNTSLPALLHWEDRNSMAQGVEGRVPFLDHDLVEHVMALPDEKKISNGTTKVILREAMQGLIPDEIVNRKDKIGFQTPEKYWFEQNEQKFRDVFMYARFRAGLPSNIDSHCVDILSGKKPYDSTLWRVVSYAEFMKAFGVV